MPSCQKMLSHFRVVLLGPSGTPVRFNELTYQVRPTGYGGETSVTE